jgi:heme/copper-type cytochrome/quinol oxidase subunit 1
VHSLVRRYIKTAIAFLMAGLLIGGWMLTRRELGLRPPTEYEISAHTHTLFVGFIMMMILGVALWLFPRPDKMDSRYRPSLVEAAYWLLTIGTASRTIGELLRAVFMTAFIRWVVVLSGLAQILGLMVFFYTMWFRIRGIGSSTREARGEKF